MPAGLLGGSSLTGEPIEVEAINLEQVLVHASNRRNKAKWPTVVIDVATRVSDHSSSCQRHEPGSSATVGLDLGLLSWVVVGGVVILTIMVLLLEVAGDSPSNSHEVLQVDEVGDVGVEVVLEVLEHVHVLLHVVVSSDSWEGEGAVVKLPGVHARWLGVQLLSDLHGVLPVLSIKVSRELVHLPFHLSSVDPKSWLAAVSPRGSESVNDAIVISEDILGLDEAVIVGLAGLRQGLGSRSGVQLSKLGVKIVGL